MNNEVGVGIHRKTVDPIGYLLNTFMLQWRQQVFAVSPPE
jgi:hypothetical protein